jgi:hypothetical protein
LADALSKARAIVEASCPSEPPLTPLGRLDAVEKRLDATRLDAFGSPSEAGAGAGGNSVESGSSAAGTLASLNER